MLLNYVLEAVIIAKINKINTQILKEKFSSIYREFFSKHQLVVSVADSFMWTGEYSAYFGGISICQKVPFRIYAGVEPIAEKKIVINESYLAYQRKIKKFLPIFFLPEEIKKISEFINDQLKIQVKRKGGCQITFFSEAPAEEGWGSLGTFAALISLTLHYYYFPFKRQNLDLWTKTKISDLIKKDPWFDRIFKFAWRTIAAAREGISSGTYALLGLINSGGFPIIYSTQADLPSWDKKIKTLSYSGERLSDLLKNDLAWHFDFGLACSGMRKSTSAGNRSIREIQADFDQIKNEAVIKDLHLSKISALFSHYGRERSLWLALMETLDIISLQILIGLKNIFQFGSSEKTLSFLFSSLNKHWDLYNILGVNIPEFELLAKVIRSQLKKTDRKDSGIKIASIGRGGYLLFSVPKYSLVNKEEKVEKKIEKKLGPQAHLGYLSWLDGTEDGAAKIEQDLKNKIFSPFVTHEDLEVTDYFASMRGIKRLFSRDEYDRQLSSIDLVFDQANQRIYLRGKQLTSKEISSAKETILVIVELLKKRGKLSSEQLPSSSYSTNRYDFAGKILLPLQRIIRKKLNKELRLKVRGGISSFLINFDPTNLRIWIVTRPF